MKNKVKIQKLNKQRQQFLLTFFEADNNYAEKQINGFWLVKHWNGENKTWQVAIYPEGHLKR